MLGARLAFTRYPSLLGDQGHFKVKNLDQFVYAHKHSAGGFAPATLSAALTIVLPCPPSRKLGVYTFIKSSLRCCFEFTEPPLMTVTRALNKGYWLGPLILLHLVYMQVQRLDN